MRLPWEEEEEVLDLDTSDSQQEEVSVSLPSFPPPDFDHRRYLNQLRTNTADLDIIEPRVYTYSGPGPASVSVLNNNNNTARLFPHQELGCSTEVTRHELHCSFREVRCPFYSCPRSLSLVSINWHVSGFHNCSYSHYGAPLAFTRDLRNMNMRDSDGTLTLRSFPPICLSLEGEHFYLQTIASPDRSLVYHFLQLEGSKEDCQSFWVKISVSGLERFTPCHSNQIMRPVSSGQASQTMRPVPIDLHCRD